MYIYGRGRRFPERTSIRIIELEKKQCFTVVKWRFFMSFFSLLMSFNHGSIFFRPSKLKSIMDHHNMFFLVFLFSPLELRGAHFVLYQRSWEKGIIYCVSTGILMWCCFSLVIHSDFAYHQNFRVLWVSCFFLFLYKSISTRHINHYRRHKPGCRQLFIANSLKRASAFKTLSKPGFLLT